MYVLQWQILPHVRRLKIVLNDSYCSVGAFTGFTGSGEDRSLWFLKFEDSEDTILGKVNK